MSEVPRADLGFSGNLTFCVKCYVLQLSKCLLRSVFALQLALVFLSPTATPTHAQGFFQSLFGGGQPSRPRMMPPRHSRYMPHGQSVPWWQQERQTQRPQSRHYTAMCVRMCDGYYWPMSNRATRGKFYNLARRCENSCNGDAKLFYMPSHSSDVKRMTDLSGRAYEHINTAFLYRKKLIKSCTCKPMPWSYSARAKHMQYAADELEQQLRLRQREQQRQAALNLKQRHLQPSARRRVDGLKPGRITEGRTIVESLDEAQPPHVVDNINLDVDGQEVTEASADQAEIGVDEQAARAAQSAKRTRIRNRRVRNYSAIRHRRYKPKPKWNAGFGGGKPAKVWPGDRPRRRYR